jgi:hypothetical protein
MEVGQGPNWCCSAKGGKIYQAASELNNLQENP